MPPIQLAVFYFTVRYIGGISDCAGFLVIYRQHRKNTKPDGFAKSHPVCSVIKSLARLISVCPTFIL